MAKPIIKTIDAFDSFIGTTINFVFNGNQIYGNHLKIYNTSDNSIVYDSLIENQTGLYHIIPANSGLSNGESYYATISVLERKLIDGSVQLVESIYSDRLLFYCYTTPEFYFEDLIRNTTISTSYINLHLVYSQKENEAISESKIIVYNETKNIVQESDIIYMGIENSTDYVINGLLNNNFYYIRALGTTIHGTSLDTGMIKIDVTYSFPDISAVLDLENDYKNGTIKIVSNLRIINHSSTIEKIDFIDNSKVNLTNNFLEYNSGFLIEDDFAIQIICKPNNKANNKFLALKGNENSISLIYNYQKTYNVRTRQYEKQYYINVSSRNKNILYTINSQKFTALTDDEYLKIILKKKNNIFAIEVDKVSN